MNNNKIDKIVIISTKWFGILLLIAIIIWGGCYFWKTYKYEQTNDAQVDAYLSPINVKIGGYIGKLFFKDNQKVHRGDTLVLIEPEEFRLKQEAALAELMSSRSKLPILDANKETQEKNIEVIKARILGSRAKLEQQQQEYERYRNLLKDESTTQQKFENVYTTLMISKSDYEETNASLKVAESKLADIKAQRLAIDAEIKTKEILLARQELDIKYTVITVPFDGQLGKKTVQEGQLVQADQTLVFLKNESEEKWVVANFKETQIGNFKVGQKTIIEVDAFPHEKFYGTIESISPTTGSRYSLLPPDNATGNFVKVIQRVPVRIKLTDDKDKLAKLLAGMNADVYIKR
ncbi:HlyD family secretion protein [Myroides injenensis]|uniref:HlyD family secretion protein n=1 Tax=Myroides injenensis TaxID=1183151 RepID=UPI000288171D|nr:HlyD family secretion protein [Myroides injenensis]